MENSSVKKDNRKKYWLIILALITVFSLTFRLLNKYDFHTSSLVYIGLPMLITLILLLSTRPSDRGGWKMKYLYHTRSALIVMLGSSVVLFEGFLCVLMFMPIYFGVVFIVFLVECAYRTTDAKLGKKSPVHILPAVLLFSSLEGVTPSLSFDRYNEVSATKNVNLSTEQIRDNLMTPMLLGDDMPVFLSLFPMPYKVDAETLSEGDVHRSYFKYNRWLVTNTHEGYLDLKLSEVSENLILTEVVENTSYFSHYLDLHGWVIKLEPITDTYTKVTLTASYDRKLDPAWYFGPLERFGIEQTAKYLIEKVIDKDGSVPYG